MAMRALPGRARISPTKVAKRVVTSSEGWQAATITAPCAMPIVAGAGWSASAPVAHAPATASAEKTVAMRRIV